MNERKGWKDGKERKKTETHPKLVCHPSPPLLRVQVSFLPPKYTQLSNLSISPFSMAVIGVKHPRQVPNRKRSRRRRRHRRCRRTAHIARRSHVSGSAGGRARGASSGRGSRGSGCSDRPRYPPAPCALVEVIPVLDALHLGECEAEEDVT